MLPTHRQPRLNRHHRLNRNPDLIAESYEIFVGDENIKVKPLHQSLSDIHEEVW